MAGANMISLLRRAKSVRNIKKMTKAMGLVATSKFQKCKVYLFASDKQFAAISGIKDDVARADKSTGGIFLGNGGKERTLYVVLNSTKGLCGGYNNNMFFALINRIREKGEHPMILTTGNKGLNILKKLHFDLDLDSISTKDIPDPEEAQSFADRILEVYAKGEVNEVCLVYTRYMSQVRNEVSIEKVLPFEGREEGWELRDSEFQFEPEIDVLKDTVYSLYLREKFYNVLVHAKVTEHSMRMGAMDTARKNADELLTKVEKQYNRMRQQTITQELTEIIGGAEAQL